MRCSYKQKGHVHQERKNCRYSFLFLRFAIALKLKVGKDRYGWLSQCFNLPSKSTIAKYTAISAGAPDGILYESLNTERIFFDEVKGEDINSDNWKRHGSLSWDSMAIKEKLYFCCNSMKIVGFADDAFDLNIIMEELKEKIKSTKKKQPANSANSPETTTAQSESTATAQSEPTKEKPPPLSKHFLVFILTTWEKNEKKQQIVVSRFGVLTLDASYIMDKLMKSICALSNF